MRVRSFIAPVVIFWMLNVIQLFIKP